MSQGSTMTGEQGHPGETMDNNNTTESLPLPPRRGGSGYPRRGSNRNRFRGARGGGGFGSSSRTAPPPPLSSARQYMTQSWGGKRQQQQREWDDFSRPRNNNSSAPREHSPSYHTRKRRKTNRDSYWSSDEETEPMSFKEFLSREDNSITPEQAQEAYNQYKKEFYKRKPKYFFEKHMNEEWFCEKYHPAKVLQRVNRIRQNCKEQVERFREMMEKESLDKIVPCLEQTVETTTDSNREYTEDNNNNNQNSSQPSTDENNTVDMGDEVQAEEEQTEETMKGMESTTHSDVHTVESSEGKANVDSEPSSCLFLRGIPCWLSREVLENTLKVVKKGDNWEPVRFIRLKLSDVKPEKNLERFGWAYYETVQDATNVMEYWNGQKLQSAQDDYYVLDMRFNHDFRKKHHKQPHSPVILPEVFQSPRRLQFDARQIVHVMRHLDKLRNIPELNPLTDDLLNSLSNERRIDVCSFYLRMVHSYCYYSGVECLDPDDDPLPPTPRRPCKKRTTDNPTSANDDTQNDNTMETLEGVEKEEPRKTGAEWRVDEPANAILRRNYDHPKGTVSVDSESLREERIAEWLEENTKYEGQGRYRCSLPPFKLFQGKEYVHKHLKTKHTEEMQKVIEKADKEQFIENYLNDPNHLDDTKVFDIRKGGGVGMFPSYMPVWLPSAPGMVAPMQSYGGMAFRGAFRGGMRRRGGPNNRRRAMKNYSATAGGSSDPRSAQGPRQYADLDAPPQGGPSVDTLLSELPDMDSL